MATCLSNKDHLPVPTLENPQHEAFAQARFAGKSLTEAHYLAGYAGDQSSASKLSQTFEIKERIAELYREAASQTPYEKTNAIRDLLTIIHTAPSDADEDHPLCEVRMGKDGSYHRLPPKLQAMSRLIKLMGWDQPEKIEVELQDNFINLLAEIRSNHKKSSSSSSSSPSSAAPPSDSTVEHPEPTNHSSTTLSDCSTTAHPSTGYQRADAIADLILIIRAKPTDASPEHPFCERRQTSWGPYHRFPSKLTALTLLSRMQGWNGPTKLEVQHDPDAKFKQLAECIRLRS